MAQITGTGRGVALAVIVSSQLMIGVDSTIVNVALPRIQHALHFGPGDLAWVLNAYTLVFGGLLLLGGRAGDILGRRRVFVAGVLIFTAASLLGGLAQNAGWLLAARAAQGVGAALAGPSTLALITTTFREGPERNRALAVSSSVIGAGSALGLLLGGVIAALASWRWVLFVNVPVGVVVAVLAVRHLRESERHAGRFDLAGALTATSGMGFLVYGLIRAATHPWSDVVVVGALLLGGLLLVAFVAVEARAAQPITPLRLFADRNRAAAYANIVLFGAGLIGPFFFLTSFFQTVRHFGPMRAGLAFLPLTVGLFVAARLAARLLSRFGAKPMMVAGSSALVLGSVWLSRIQPDTGYLTGILWPLLIMGLSAGCAFIPMYTFILSGITSRDAGAAAGVLQTTQWLGGTLGLAVLVSVASGDLRRAFLTTGGLAFAALCLTVLVVRGRERPVAAASAGAGAGAGEDLGIAAVSEGRNTDQ
jgi:EmrB/QacA subfamily drug resistance transporter